MSQFIWNKAPLEIVYSSDMASLYSQFNLTNYVGFPQYIIQGYNISVFPSIDNVTLEVNITSGTGVCYNQNFDLLYDVNTQVITPLISTPNQFSGTFNTADYPNGMVILALATVTNAVPLQPTYTIETNIQIVDAEDPYFTSPIPFADPDNPNQLILGRMVLGIFDTSTFSLNQNLEIRLSNLLLPSQNVISVSRVNSSDPLGVLYGPGILICPASVYPGCTGLLLLDNYVSQDSAIVVKFTETRTFTPGILPGVLNLPIITEATTGPDYYFKTGLIISTANPTSSNTCLFLCDDGTAILMPVPVGCPVDETVTNLGYQLLQPIFAPYSHYVQSGAGLGLYKYNAVSGNAYYVLGNSGSHYQAAFL